MHIHACFLFDRSLRFGFYTPSILPKECQRINKKRAYSARSQSSSRIRP
ncbi:hypothetical protein HM1_1066 [Heliomicrobium modesticaldum Ice1]|uniref:Uncharacterized protein n=1 Tax=Heliobacterium modesticaldum (strain ATCC 51547 / Ice1) TaxID=498761 RepID=B0TI87_HELMI|nr:hypothetical protein HM1_1066 [Heliomicrobium modesticaldum Ice1]